ncbi:hypothetical protein F2P81_024160 [Scophthalmus maximus]|uniref:Uncharacterized protein n=1 Tax=Scophthalmus maximus TaxID=52904 RepID=A0A6A4RVY8_SCOMX|nr:hypothetical protein F2P81_024160 [Scophthalmus maximus]
MELPMSNCKRPRFSGYENEPPLSSKKCLSSLKTLLDRYPTNSSDRATQHARLMACRGHLCTREAGNLTSDKLFSEQISSWADTQNSVKKVLEHLVYLGKATGDIFLNDAVAKKFLEFHRDITEECGAEEKQHSWAVIEKEEEIVMYGPYYPNYSKGIHSEDIIIQQTEELLESEEFSQQWKVYVFTMNSPCLARNTEPCMINLVQKAHAWWTAYGVKTHIGFVRCWGFRGTKETLFRDIDYGHVDCINQTGNHGDYVEAAKNRTNLNPLCENLRSAVKHLLTCADLSFPLMTTVREQDWNSYFKKVHSIFECKPEGEKKVFAQKLDAAIEAARALLSAKSRSFDKHLEGGKAFPLHSTFAPQVSEALQDEMTLAFQQCWREMVQDKYADFLRGKLTEQFNQCAVQLFIKDIVKFTGRYLHIGRIKFSKEHMAAFEAE